MTRRNGKGRRDQDLMLALLRLEAAFGPVQVLELRPNRRLAGLDAAGNQTRNGTTQAVLDLDGDHQREGVRRSPDAVDARPRG